MDIRACLFDVFGTVVDWRTSVSREFAAFARGKGITHIDPVEFAVEWLSGLFGSNLKRAVEHTQALSPIDGRGALGAPAVRDP